MKSMKLNTSAKYKNNKFQIKYLKYERYNMVLFATYSTGYNNDNVFYIDTSLLSILIELQELFIM
jgi:hypothetical protein